MTNAVPAGRESERLDALRRLGILDTPPEAHYDAVCRLARDLFEVPVALVSFVDAERLWFKARCGGDGDTIDRDGTFCEAAIQADEVLVVEDAARDARFAAHPLVTGKAGIRFYVGAPLSLAPDVRLGTVCLLDTAPRTFSAKQVGKLRDLGDIVLAHLRLQEAGQAREAESRALRAARDAQRIAETTASFGHWRIDPADRTVAWSEGITAIFGCPVPDRGRVPLDAHLSFYHPDDRGTARARIEDIIAGSDPETRNGYQAQARVVRLDGTERVVTIRSMPVRDATGRATAVYGVLLDITEQVRADDRLRETSDVLRTTLENMSQGLICYGPDQRVRVHNARAREIIGLPAEVLHDGARMADVHRYLVGQGELQGSVDHLGHMVRTGDAGAVPRIFERTRPNGTTFEVTGSTSNEGGIVWTFTDITPRKAAEAALRASEVRFRLLAETTTDIVIWSGLDTVRRYVSPAVRAVLGYAPEDLVGTRPLDFVHPDDVGAYRAVLADLTHARIEQAVCQQRYRHSDGSYLWIEVSFSLTHDPATGRPDGYVASLRDITARKQAELQIAHMAGHDALTGLPNRRLFRERLNEALDGAGRDRGGVAVLCLDLDGFKGVNDTLGHPAGDQLLCVVAERLRGVVREGDTVARLGGDEFAIIQAGLDEVQMATGLAQRIIEALAQPVPLDGHPATIGVSVGIALRTAGHDGADDLFRRADIALYRAKAAGRGTFRVYEPGMDTATTSRIRSELGAHDAARNGRRGGRAA